jgi:hypothetical protein
LKPVPLRNPAKNFAKTNPTHLVSSCSSCPSSYPQLDGIGECRAPDGNQVKVTLKNGSLLRRNIRLALPVA